MDKKGENRKHIEYIDGLKGITCILIMCGHYYGIYKYADNSTDLLLPILSIFNKKPLAFLVNESFWLSLFFVISGYLISIQSIKNVSDLVQKYINRALRFLLPIMGACIFIYFIYLLLGFHNYELQNLITNTWLESFYRDDISIKTVLIEPFRVVFKVRETPNLNSPWWCIGGMFYTSLVIYTLNFIKSKNPKLVLILMIVTMPILWIHREDQFVDILISGLLGMVVCWFKDVTLNKKIYILGAIIIVFVSVCQIRNDLKSLYFALLLGIVPQLHCLNTILSSYILSFLGTISFGIYSFHWPIFCSIGILVFKSRINIMGMETSLLSAYVISIAASLCLAYIYHIIVEMPITRVLNYRKY